MSGAATKKGWRSWQRCGPVLFLLLILLPLADMAFRFAPEVTVREKRRLAPAPRFAWRQPLDFLRQGDAYFRDHFGFRGLLVQLHNRIVAGCLGSSPSAKVVVGRRGWLFMARETESRDEMEYFRRLRPFTQAELQDWRLKLRQRRDWLAARGIAYLFLVVPNKSTVYAEHVPARFRPLERPSRLDQLLAELGREGDFPVLDLRRRFQAAKGGPRLYSKTDSHWNDLGAFHAFAAILEMLAPRFPGLRPPDLGSYVLRVQDRAGGDLAQMLGLQKRAYREERIQLQPRQAARTRNVQSRRLIGPYIRMAISETPAAELPPLLVVHDSFIHQLKPFLDSRFRRVAYVWDWGLHFFPDVVDREKPALVIDEIAERMLCDLKLENPPALAPLPEG